VVDDHDLESAADLGPDGSHGEVTVRRQVLAAQPSKPRGDLSMYEALR
jgi:hypothetical protein